MFDEKKNLKDEDTALGISVKDKNVTISYKKTNKLVIALYMVTDIMDKEEPLRNKLRTLGTNIISDIHFMPAQALPKISEILSFIDIAGVVDLISEMNLSILRKEFLELQRSIQESVQSYKPTYSEVNLSDLFQGDYSLPSEHVSPTRIGVQKGSTLLKALNEIKIPTRPIDTSDKGSMSDRKTSQSSSDFEVLKGQRRSAILTIISKGSNGATISDIKTQATGSLMSCSEKTIQRELVRMVKAGVLKKLGEKRWSRYFIA